MFKINYGWFRKRTTGIETPQLLTSRSTGNIVTLFEILLCSYIMGDILSDSSFMNYVINQTIALAINTRKSPIGPRSVPISLKSSTTR